MFVVFFCCGYDDGNASSSIIKITKRKGPKKGRSPK
jgi:hypothetical protein